MQHDKEWLKNNNPFHAESGVNSAGDFDEMACDYHEHMNRWRPLTDKPNKSGDCILYDPLTRVMQRCEFIANAINGWGGALAGMEYWKSAGDFPDVGE